MVLLLCMSRPAMRCVFGVNVVLAVKGIICSGLLSSSTSTKQIQGHRVIQEFTNDGALRILFCLVLNLKRRMVIVRYSVALSLEIF